MDQLQKALDDFRRRRGWGSSVRPDSPNNLAKSIAVESAELLEHFQWSEDGYDLNEVGMEIADIYIYLVLMANHLSLDLNRLAVEKIAINDDRFPPRDGQKMDFNPYLKSKQPPKTKEVMDLLVEFRSKRDWAKVSTPANFAKSIFIESAELLEHFQWSENNYDPDKVKYEIADVYIYLLGLSAHLGLDPNRLGLQKLALNEDRFPAS